MYRRDISPADVDATDASAPHARRAVAPTQIPGPETSNAVMTALLIHDLNEPMHAGSPNMALDNPQQIFSQAASRRHLGRVSNTPVGNVAHSHESARSRRYLGPISTVPRPDLGPTPPQGSFHGGTWRCGYTFDSIGVPCVLAYYLNTFIVRNYLVAYNFVQVNGIQH